MSLDPNRLIWIDMEMTGLRPETDRIIEVALVITIIGLLTLIWLPALIGPHPLAPPR